MAWLSSGGTDFSYRMRVPDAQPQTARNARIVIRFPMLALLKAQGKIVQAAYEDIHVTASDGTTELPCFVDAVGKKIHVDYAAMPQGRTTLYVYYGHASCPAPAAPAWTPESGGVLIDNGFDSGVSGNTLASPPWSVSRNAPQQNAYNHAFPRGSSAMEAIVQGQNLPSPNWAGIAETTSSGNMWVEHRLWVRFDSTTGYYLITDNDYTTTDPAFVLRFNASGQIEYYTYRGTAGFYQIGTYTANTWTQIRIIVDLYEYKVSYYKRASASDAWTTLAEDAPIAGTSNTITANHGLAIDTYDNAVMRVDDVQASAAPISDGYAGGLTQTMDPCDERASLVDTNSRLYISGWDVDLATLDSAAASTYYGGRGLNALRVGVTAAGAKRHGLVKFIEGRLPVGTVSSAKLWLNLESKTMDAAGTIKAFRFLNTGESIAMSSWSDMLQKRVSTGWIDQDIMPTWDIRYYNYQAVRNVAWQTAGAVGTNEINLSDPDAPSLVIATGEALGYKSITCPNAWFNAWQGDDYSMGLLLKDSTEAGGQNRYAAFSHQGSASPPVLEIVFSDLGQQLEPRKLSADTYHNALGSGGPDRFAQIGSAYQNGVVAWVNNRLKLSVAYVCPDGHISRAVRNTYPGEILNYNVPLWGIYYDSSDGRYWVAGNDSNQKLVLGISDPYNIKRWTWYTHTVSAYKAMISVRNGVCSVVYGDYTSLQLYFTKFVLATASWSVSPVVLHTPVISGITRTLSAGILAEDVMEGTGTIFLNGAADSYPVYGVVRIGTEDFWHSGKSGSTLTGVTRAIFGTTAAAHSIGDSATMRENFASYVGMVYDSVRACLHVVYVVNDPAGGNQYIAAAYLRHNDSDPDSVWRDEANNILTLPVDQLTQRIFTTSAGPSIYAGLNMLANGDFLIVYRASSNMHLAGGAQMNDLRTTRLANGGTSFSEADPADTFPSSPTELGAGRAVIIGTSIAGGRSTEYLQSHDGGVTWDDMVPMHTFAFPYAHRADEPDMWFAGITPAAGFDNQGLSYAMHLATHGAIWLHLTDFILPPASGGVFGLPSVWGLIR